VVRIQKLQFENSNPEIEKERMMKARIATSLTALALVALVGSSAQETMVAGWDFSQYAGDGFMSIDGGSSFANTLDANYSDLDPTLGAGAESAAFGTMYVDGQFGSTNVPVGTGNEQFLPSAAVSGSLASNLDAPGGVSDFDSFNTLLSEGQLSAESLAMIAAAQSIVVFEADLGSVPVIGSNWSISFGARTFAGTSTVGIEFSSDGVTFTPFGSQNLNTVDTLFTVNLGAATNHADVRLTFNPVGINQPLIDNVALNATLAVPEPSTAVFGALGLIGLVIAGRKRTAARA
jgi:hypothetical protein